MLCTDEFKCGTSNKPCRNRVCIHIKLNIHFFCYLNFQKVYEIICAFPFFRIRTSIFHLPMKVIEFVRGFRLSSDSTDVPTEEQHRVKENNDVKVLCYSIVRCCVFFS